MKISNLVLIAVLFGLTPAFGGFSERKLESAMKSAEKSGKLLAFVFWQDFWDPNCPKCVAQVSANNNATKNAIPRSDVVMVEIDKGDKDLDKLPACVPKDGGVPRVVVTDATGTKVVATLPGAPDRKLSREFEQKVEEARGPKK
jgi:hypothetical protein